MVPWPEHDQTISKCICKCRFVFFRLWPVHLTCAKMYGRDMPCCTFPDTNGTTDKRLFNKWTKHTFRGTLWPQIEQLTKARFIFNKEKKMYILWMLVTKTYWFCFLRKKSELICFLLGHCIHKPLSWTLRTHGTYAVFFIHVYKHGERNV